jgi:hypothetical protein
VEYADYQSRQGTNGEGGELYKFLTAIAAESRRISAALSDGMGTRLSQDASLPSHTAFGNFSGTFWIGASWPGRWTRQDVATEADQVLVQWQAFEAKRLEDPGRSFPIPRDAPPLFHRGRIESGSPVARRASNPFQRPPRLNVCVTAPDAHAVGSCTHACMGPGEGIPSLIFQSP